MPVRQRPFEDKYEKSGRPSVIPRVLAVIILTLALISSAAIYFRQESEYERLAAENARLEQQRTQLRDENIALDGEINSVGTPEYVARIARERLGMVSPDEVVFRDGEAPVTPED